MVFNDEWKTKKSSIFLTLVLLIVYLGCTHGLQNKTDSTELADEHDITEHNETGLHARLSGFIPSCLLTCGIPNPQLPITLQISAGIETGISEYPWMGYLIDRESRSFIGGATLITDEYLLTSASLVSRLVATNTAVVLGDHDRSIQDEASSFSVRVDRFIVHPDFVRHATGYSAHDIAVIRLRTKVAFTRRVRPICLPWPSLAFIPHNSLFHEQVVTVTGWGTSNPNGPGLSRVLRATDLTVIPQAKCQTQLNVNLPDSVFCAAPDREDTGTCIGDIGGPAAWDPQTPLLQANIFFSIGIILPNQKCHRTSPNVFTRVDKYLDFIRRNTNIQHCGSDFLAGL